MLDLDGGDAPLDLIATSRRDKQLALLEPLASKSAFRSEMPGRRAAPCGGSSAGAADSRFPYP
jgi:hypothetical protein